MSVTRDVSQLSGWLKADAYCRGSQAGHTVQGAGCGLGGGRRRATEACMQRGEGKAHMTADWGTGHGEQRTQNMLPMSVTWEVFQLSGWLKADAYCRGSQAGHTVKGGLRASRRREAARASAVHAARAQERGQVTADI